MVHFINSILILLHCHYRLFPVISTEELDALEVDLDFDFGFDDEIII